MNTKELEAVIRKHTYHATTGECECGAGFGRSIPRSFTHARHLAIVLANVLASEAPKNPEPHLAEAAREYHKAVRALHLDENGKPHCAIQCNELDESHGIVSETRFHEDLLKQHEDAEMRFQIEYTASLAQPSGEGAKPEPSKKQHGAGPENIFESGLHAWGPDGNCRGCGHWSGRHEIESIEERTLMSPTMVTVITDVHCHECGEEEEI